MIYLIDLFCGGGGTSTGASLAKGVKVIYCVNHDPMAIKSHAANHPDCIHSIEDIRTLDLTEVKEIISQIKQREPKAIIGLWASLECTNHSKAKGGLPRNADSRTLAFDLYRYIEQLLIDIVYIENVREFMVWGQLDKDLKPINDCSEYNRWVKGMKEFGYSYDWKLLNSADYGAYTSRIRYFAQFAKPHINIKWAEPTHSKKVNLFRPTWRSVKPCLNLKDEGKSIFNRKKPLSDNTFKRILAGLNKFITKNELFTNQHLSTYYNNFGLFSLEQPSPTVTTKDRISKIAVNFIDQQYKSGAAKSLDDPLNTITTIPKFNIVKVEHLLFDLAWGGKANSIKNPCLTIVATQDKSPLYLMSLNQGVQVPIYDYDTEIVIEIKKFMLLNGISDIKMRMLHVEELLQIQGFPKNYKLFGTQAEQKKFIGNAVEVNVAKHILETSAKTINYGCNNNNKKWSS
jgi:DNA (cytosine-5)-methyltransferase 1